MQLKKDFVNEFRNDEADDLPNLTGLTEPPVITSLNPTQAVNIKTEDSAAQNNDETTNFIPKNELTDLKT